MMLDATERVVDKVRNVKSLSVRINWVAMQNKLIRKRRPIFLQILQLLNKTRLYSPNWMKISTLKMVSPRFALPFNTNAGCTGSCYQRGILEKYQKLSK